jgi:hypothetical protein
MKWIIRIGLALFFGLMLFGAIQHYFQLARWASVLLATLGGIFAALGVSIDLLKKWYELRKLWRDDKEATAAKGRIIRLPTADEVRMHGQSLVERALYQRFSVSEQVRLEPSRFVARVHEKRVEESG